MIIQVKDMLDALNSVKVGLNTKEFIQQSTSFVFFNNKVYTYNDEIIAVADLEFPENGSILAEPLLKFLQKIKTDTINISIDCDEKKIILKTKSATVQLGFDPEIKIPIENVNASNIHFNEIPNNFNSLALKAAYTASTTYSNYILSCVCIENNKIKSCDNDRITLITFDTNIIDTSILLTAKNFIKILQNNITGIGFDSTWVYFKCVMDNGAEYFLICRLVNESFLDVDQFIPDFESDVVQEIEFPDLITSSIDRAEIFSKDIISAENNIDLELKNKKLLIKAHNQYGSITERLKMNSELNIKFSINVTVFRDILKESSSMFIIEDTLFYKNKNELFLIKIELSEDKGE